MDCTMLRARRRTISLVARAFRRLRQPRKPLDLIDQPRRLFFQFERNYLGGGFGADGLAQFGEKCSAFA